MSFLRTLTELFEAGYPKEVAARIASGELPMDRASRMERARQQGFDPDDIQYHGTFASDIEEVDPYLVDLGIHTGNPQQAAQRLKNLEEDFGSKAGANVLPLLTRSRNPLEMRDVGDFKNSTTVLEGLVGNPKLANRRMELEDLYEQSDALQAGFQNSEKSFRESLENRDILDEIRAILDQEGFDSIKYQNQVENAYGDLADLTPQAKQQKIEIGQEITKLEAEAMKNRPPAPDPSDPMAEEKLQVFLSASSNPASYMNDQQLVAYENLKDAYRAIGDNPNNYMDTSSRITLYPEDVRSQFAAFDPQYKGANILGGTAATAIGAGALMAPDQAQAAIEDVDIFEEESPMTYRDRRRDRRQRAQAQRERLAGDSEPLLSGAQAANLLAGFTGAAGIADIFGEYPEFPEGDVSVEEMLLEGQRGPSLAENISEGNYLSAGLQTLGVLPVVGIGARAAAKALRSADGITSLPINKQIEVMETVREGTKLDAPVFAPKIFEEGGKPDVRRMEAALKSNQGDLSSIDDMVERAQNVNDGFQSNVAEVAKAVGGKKAGKFITLKDGSQFDVEVKSRKSIADKVERKGLTPSEFTDGVRTTIYVDTADQAEEAVQRLGALYPSIDRGWQRLPDTGYFDRKMNLAIEDPKTGGYIIGEIQIKTPEMAEAAIPGHRWYEYSRKLEGRYDHKIPATKIQLYKRALEEQRRLYGEAESVADPEILRQLVEKFKAGGAVASPRRSHRSGIQTLA